MKKILKFLLSSSNWIDWLFSETKDGIASRGGKSIERNDTLS